MTSSPSPAVPPHDQRPLVHLGIDLGGTSLRVGAFDAGMQLLASRVMPTRVRSGPQAVVTDMADAIASLLDETTARAEAIGLGSPGPLNLDDGTLGQLPNFPGWDFFPLRSALEDLTGLPVVLDGDANAAALAEWKLGAGRNEGVDSMAMLTLGTGVGSGIITRRPHLARHRRHGRRGRPRLRQLRRPRLLLRRPRLPRVLRLRHRHRTLRPLPRLPLPWPTR